MVTTEPNFLEIKQKKKCNSLIIAMIYNKSGVSSYGSVLLSLIFDHHSLTFDLINLRFGILYSIMLNIP